MKSFEYHAPETLDAAIDILSHHEAGAFPLAGGTDLVTSTRYGHIAPKVVVNLKRVPGLAEVTVEDNGGLRLGALVRLNQIAGSEQIQQHCALLSQTAAKMASPLIRNLATVGGNLCNAAPSADLAQPLIALDAEAVIAGPSRERRVPLKEFFTGPGNTVLSRDELLTAVLVPSVDPLARSVYIKHTYRQAMDIAIVGVAAVIRFDARDAVCRQARLVLGAVAPTPLRAYDAEIALEGAILTDDRIARAAQLAARAARPIDDTYSSAWYRREMVEVLTRRALHQLVHQEER